MAYSAVPLVATGDLWTAANQNTYLRDNMSSIWVGTTAGDVDYYTGAAAKSRLAIGTGGQVQTVNDGATAPEWAGGLKLIEEILLGAPAASFDFTAIPQYFTHLKIMYQARGDRAAASDNVYMTFNNDGGANYDYEVNEAGTALTTEVFAAAFIRCGNCVAGTGTANIANQGVIFINNYSGAVFNKTCNIHSALKDNNVANIATFDNVGFWRNTAAITRVTIYTFVGDFDTGSIASLYGIG